MVDKHLVHAKGSHFLKIIFRPFSTCDQAAPVTRLSCGVYVGPVCAEGSLLAAAQEQSVATQHNGSAEGYVATSAGHAVGPHQPSQDCQSSCATGTLFCALTSWGSWKTSFCTASKDLCWEETPDSSWHEARASLGFKRPHKTRCLKAFRNTRR